MTQTNLLRRLLLLLILCGSATATEQIRCALIVDKGEELRSSALVSLLGARLSQDSRLQLVERAQIDTILREQQVSLATAAEPNVAVKVGRLLRADAFVLLSVESPGGENLSGNPPNERGRAIENVDSTPTPDSPPEPVGQLLRVRVVETAHGLRLSDRYEQLDKADVQTVAERIAERVRIVVQKIGQPTGQVIPVGIIDIHRVQLPERYERLARVLPGLLSARLGAEPRILMLERESLGTLLKEKQLTDGNDSAFWNSAVLIDGNIQPDGNDVKISLRLRRENDEGLSQIETAVDPNAPFAAVDKAAAAIVKAVSNTPLSIPWDPVKEAGEFYHQGQLLSAHRRFETATIAFETAHALKSDDVHYTAALFANEWRNHQMVVSDGVPRIVRYASTYSDQQYAELAAILIRQIKRSCENGSASGRDIYNRWAGFIGDDFNRGYLGSAASVATEQIRRINRESRRIWVETMGKVIDAEGSPHASVGVRAGLVWVGSDEPAELMANLRRIFVEVLFPPQAGGTIESWDERSQLFSVVIPIRLQSWQSSNAYAVSHLCVTEKEFRRLWRAYLEELAETNDLLLRFHSCIALVAEANPLMQPEESRRTESYFRKAVVAYRELDSHSSPLGDYEKARLCGRIRNLLHGVFFTDPSKEIDAIEGIVAPMIDANEVESLTRWNLGEYVPVAYEQDLALAKCYYELLERVAAVLKDRSKVPAVAAALRHMRDWQAKARRHYPELGVETKRPMPMTTILLAKGHWPEDMYTASPEHCVVLNGRILWMVRVGQTFSLRPIGSEDDTRARHRYEVTMRFAGIDLTRKEIFTWSHVQVLPPKVTNSRNRTSVAIGERATYVSIGGVGLVELQGNLEKTAEPSARVLTQEEGLPSIQITDMAMDVTRLWVAYSDIGGSGESGLSAYDPNSKHWETVFCSTLKGDNPFNARPYTLTRLKLLDPNTLLFYASFSGDPVESRALSGMWEMDAKSLEIKHIPEGLSDAGRGGSLWKWPDAVGSAVSGRDSVVKRVTLVQGDPTIQQLAQHIQGVFPLPTPQQETFAFQYSWPPGQYLLGPYYGGNLDLSTAAIHGGRLWACLGTSEIAIIPQGKSF